MRRRRSPSLSTPTSVPASSITGNPLTWRLTIKRIASATLARGETETIIVVITSLTRIQSSSGRALSLERGCHRQAKGVLMRINPLGMAHGCRLRFSRDEGSLSGGQARPEDGPGRIKKARQWRTGGVVRNERLRLLVSLGSRPQVPSAQTRQSGRCCRQEGRCASRARFGNAKRKTRGRKGADDGARSCVTCRAVILGAYRRFASCARLT